MRAFLPEENGAAAENRTVCEGVERTPVSPSSASGDNLLSGVAAIPGAGPDNKRRHGCMLLASAAFVLWAGIAWVLWYWAINAPMPPEDEKSAPFELMPRAEGS